MNFSFNRSTTLALASVLFLSGCFSASNEDPMEQQEEADELVTLTDNQVALYYKRDDGIYDNWGLHLWSGEGCANYASPTSDSSNFNNWADPLLVSGIDDTYGAYWVLDYEAGSGDCLNFIVHQGDDKALGSNNGQFDLTQSSPHAFTFHGNASIFYDAITELPVSLSGAKLHWVDKNTLVWDGMAANTILLFASTAAGFNYDGVTQQITDSSGTAVGMEITSGTLSDATKAKFPHLAGYDAFSVTFTDDSVRSMLKEQLIAVALNSSRNVIAITKVQIPGVLDDLYTSGDTDADEQILGATVNGANVDFAVWAPTAQSVNLHAFDAEKNLLAGFPVAMVENTSTGIFAYQGEISLDEAYYQYEVTAYHPVSNKIETMMVTDPYSLSLSTNSTYSQVVDLSASNSKPDGWDTQTVIPLDKPEDIIVYETHIRDFSATDNSLSDASNKGKYGAFTETTSDAMNQLQQLQSAGLNHLHLMPTFDIATINEDETQVVNIDDPVSDLCALNSNAAVCSDTSVDQGSTIRSALQSYVDADNKTEKTQQLVEDMRGYDSYNWGYDPYHYTVPEGSYAKNPEGLSRIVEFRSMVKALHDMDLRVVMDVVYNHTNASGLSSKSVLDKVVPGYYHRLNSSTGGVETSTCCDNTATEHVMMGKLMTDSLVTWAEQYKIDGFRFDLMGHQPKAAMLAARNAVVAIDADTYFYGEGWNFGEVANDSRFEQATQANMAGTSIGTFSDRLRDAIRGGGPFDSQNALRANQGLSNGLKVIANEVSSGVDAEYLLSMDQARIGLSGNLSSFILVNSTDKTVRGSDIDYNGQPTGYALDPADTINYISKHDNQTLWDNNQYRIPFSSSSEDRVRMQILGLAYPIFSQGIPFIHMGAELLRSKSFLRDSYDFGDWFNAVDFSKASNNYNIGLPPADKDKDNWPIVSAVLDGNAGVDAVDSSQISSASLRFMDLLKIRSQSPLFKLATADDIKARVDFHNTGSNQTDGLIAMSIDDGTGLADLDAANDAIVVLFNNDDEAKTITIDAATGFELHPLQSAAEAADDIIRSSASFDEGTSSFSVPALSVAVFVKPQGENQASGLAVGEKALADIPPFGDTTVYIRGDFNDWGTDNSVTYGADFNYRTVLILEAGSYAFKVASADWNTVNLGNGASINLAEAATLSDGGDNISVDIAVAGEYLFVVNAQDLSAVSLTVSQYDAGEPFTSTPFFIRGSMNDWGTDNQLTTTGLGIYTTEIALTAGSYEFKIADADWSDINLGFVEILEAAGSAPFSDISNNIGLSIVDDGNYLFSVNLMNPAKPIVSVTRVLEVVTGSCTILADSADTAPYGDTLLAVRGDHSEWNWDATYQLKYKGSNIYQAVFNFSGTMQFKIASDAGNWDPQFFVLDGSSVNSDLQLDTLYDVTGRFADEGGDPGNNTFTFNNTAVSFEFTIDEPLVNSGVAKVGTLVIKDCS